MESVAFLCKINVKKLTDGDYVDLLEKVMSHFKCCETKARSIISKYKNNGNIEYLEKLVKEG